jgi:hypothetical protein
MLAKLMPVLMTAVGVLVAFQIAKRIPALKP